ncbi:alpha/beta hydrolase [Nocardia sp. SYP-A9097]|uniref:alpha/beta hydrolase family protein n=1 Tax=Nocardia sp. SYP-A9097 TaxID=2663237 RepID=UPI00129ACF14|nr:acyl-CoA thioester hydrolase/BAAT C-terminal domain-containing protein [Nocardia sp. SYP-A9097]MRH88007.1 alpha/beta hydrolase [Nocardia sp. SYP-A9097]
MGRFRRGLAGWVLILGVAAGGVGAGASVANAQPAQTDTGLSEVSFESHGVTLHGTVYGPADSRRHPGIVLVHGSGPGPRDEYLAEARAFAAAGIITLVYDKRTVGYSTRHRDFSVLADDAIAAVTVLRQRADVDSSAVGLWGFSEGGWVAPLAAARSRDIAYVVTIGGSGRTPLRTQTWYLRNQLAHQGVSGSLPDAVAGPGTQVIGGTGVFPEADFDPVPMLDQVRVPVLALWGEHDVKVPAAESADVFQRELGRAGNTSVTTGFVPGAGHNGHRSTDGFDKVGGDIFEGRPLGEFVPGYADVITAWIHLVAAGQPPPSSAAQPPHPAVASVQPIGRPGYEYAALAALLLGFALPLLSAVARMLLRRDPSGLPRPIRRSVRALSALGLVTVLGTVGYVIWVLATGTQISLGTVIFGQPLPWLIWKASAVAVLIAIVGLAVFWWRNRSQVVGGQRIQLTLLILTGLAFVPWSIHWQLFG